MTALARIALAVAVLTGAGMLTSAAPAVADGVEGCEGYGAQGFCVQWKADGSADSASGGSSSGGGEVLCYWRTLRPIAPEEVERGLVPNAPAGVPLVLQIWDCPETAYIAGTPFVTTRWAMATTVSPEDLAAAATARLARRLPAPAVVSSPPEGTAAIVSVPVFVAVSNWTGPLRESECGAGLCVTVVAEPQLSFSPGDPGSGVIECAGAGTRHVEGADPVVEAQQPGACAHPYLLRTGVAGRPEAWDGLVSVTWVISWSSSGGASGTLPTVSRSVPLPRPVDEVQSVVVGGRVP